MYIGLNDHIRVENYVTNEHSQMRVIDVFGYHGQFIVYVELAARFVWLPNRAEGKATRIHKPARPSCFVVLPNSGDTEVSQFVDAVRGLALRVKKGKDYLKVVPGWMVGWKPGKRPADRALPEGGPAMGDLIKIRTPAAHLVSGAAEGRFVSDPTRSNGGPSDCWGGKNARKDDNAPHH